MRNYYATSIGYPMTLHAFAGKTDRDKWVNEHWGTHTEASSDGAGLIAICHGRVICHGESRIPKSWECNSRTWHYEQTGDPDVLIAIAH